MTEAAGTPATASSPPDPRRRRRDFLSGRDERSVPFFSPHCISILRWHHKTSTFPVKMLGEQLASVMADILAASTVVIIFSALWTCLFLSGTKQIQRRRDNVNLHHGRPEGDLTPSPRATFYELNNPPGCR